VAGWGLRLDVIGVRFGARGIWGWRSRDGMGMGKCRSWLEEKAGAGFCEEWGWEEGKQAERSVEREGESEEYLWLPWLSCRSC